MIFWRALNQFMVERRRRTDAALLLDMMFAAQNAIKFVSGLDEARFIASDLHQNAVIRALEIVGEAASKVSASFQAECPEIPWRDIIGLRHWLIHGYADVRLELVWIVVRDRLPPLIASLTPLIPPDHPADG